ncbi:MAG: hypothetical protein JO022_20940, partial [Acidobacteriaceae bacterium]|nr:hypothetical protein [Acidobacteriaceae bacterium]
AGTFREAERLLADFNIRTVIGGTAASITVVGPRGPVHSSDFSVTVPASVKSAVLETQAGNLIASDLAGELNGQTRAGRIELDRLGAAASVRTGGGEVHVGRVAGGVRCYSGGGNIRAEAVGNDSWFETAGGDIQIGDGSGPIHAMTAGGNIKVDRCSADVFARTGAGVIDVRQAGGLVTADNSSGAIQIESARGVRCESSAGAIRLRNVGDGAMEATTAMGNILAELLSGTRIRDSLLSTNAGDITVFLASNIPVTVQARNETPGGRRGIISEFPEIRIRLAGFDGSMPLFAEGALNGGGPVLRISASGGTIYLRRHK